MSFFGHNVVTIISFRMFLFYIVVRIPYPNILVLVLVSLIKLLAYIVNRNIMIVRAGPDFALLLGLGLVYYK